MYHSKKLTKTTYSGLIVTLIDTIFMNAGNSKTNEPHKFRLTLAGKLNLKGPNKSMALGNLSIYYTWKNIKSAYYNNKFEICAPTWSDEFDLPN